MAIDNSRKSAIYRGIKKLLDGNERFQHLVFQDAAFRIAGTGSLGLDRYCVLCYSKKKGKHFLIDVKESRQSCFRPVIKTKQPGFRNEAERVNTAAYLMQFNSPAFMATVNIDGKWFMVRELQRVSDKMTLADFGTDFGSFSAVAKEMAVLMGYAHVRSSGHMGSSTADELKQFAKKKQWQRDIIQVSGELAKKNNKYYKEYVTVE